MSLLTKISPQSQAYDLDAFMVPAHWFFCRRIEIPSDLEKGEEEGFALLELESLSPFPLEHLHYGYMLDTAGRYAFVFAAYKRRFEKVDSSDWRRIDAVLPDFIIALHSGAKQSDGLILVTVKSLVSFAFDEASDLPAGFYAEARVLQDEEGEGASLEQQLEAFKRRSQARLSVSRFREWEVGTIGKWEGRKAWFGATDASTSEQQSYAFTRGQIWKADMRDPEQVALAKRDERQNGILWKAIGVLAACVCLMVLGEVYWGGSYGYLSYREKNISEVQPLVREIEALQRTSYTLRDFQESNLRPFEMIRSLVPFQQKPAVLYRKFETAGPDTLIIDAKARNRTEVNEFKKRLERFNKIETVELSKVDSRASEVTFTATIRFKFGAFYEIAEVSSNG